MDASHQARIHEVVRRITVLARFRPARGDPAFERWSSIPQGDTI
jgi:hypothetical protein